MRRLAAEDKNVRVILNSRNFGHIRSPFYGMLQARGDAVIPFVADLQEPTELIAEFLKQWEAGHKIVMGVKTQQRRIAADVRHSQVLLSPRQAAGGSRVDQ